MNEILLEYYQGKTKELIRCEQYLNEIIKIEKSAKILSGDRVTKNTEWNKKLEDELTKFFKVKKINIFWQDGAINAGTYKPLAFSTVDANSALKSGGTSSLTMHIMVYSEVITKANLNAQELMAVLLHEIGHNFYYCPIQVGFQTFCMIVSFPIGLIVSLVSKLINVGILYIDDFLKREVTPIYNIFAAMTNIYNEICAFFKPVAYLSSLANRLVSYVQNPLNLVNVFTGYGDERGADSFAAMYGYGPDQASGLRKMTNAEEMVYGKIVSHTGAAGSVYNDMCELSCDLMAMMMLDPHPSHNQRAAVMLKKLKKDLQTNDYPKAMKKDLEKEIKRMEDMYKIVNTNASPSKVQIRQKWYDFINFITKDKSDFRELFSFYYDSFMF